MDQDHTAVRNLKRKQEECNNNTQLIDSQRDQTDKIVQQILVLKSAASSSLSDRVTCAAAKTALKVLSELVGDGIESNLNSLVLFFCFFFFA